MRSKLLAAFWIVTLTFFLTSIMAQNIVVDNDDGAPAFQAGPTWRLSGSPGYNNGTYIFSEEADGYDTAEWRPDLPVSGAYELKAILRTSTNRATAVPYFISGSDGGTTVTINQNGLNEITEIDLGTFNFNSGTTGFVRITNQAGSGAVIADAIRFLGPDQPNSPPEISNVEQEPAFPVDMNYVNVSATVTDDDTVSKVEVVYTPDTTGSPVSVEAFDNDKYGDGIPGNSIYGTQIPGFPSGVTVNYVVKATDDDAEISESPVYQYTVGQAITAEYRSIWADTWNASILNPSQCDDLINTCRENNINTVMVEIRKIGDAYYMSNIEPRATNISGGASFDPLAYLLQIAHDTSGGKPYVHVHGWFVMQRISRGETLSPMHVLSQHPEYIMSDSSGNTSSGGSIFIDPGHPGAVDHNVSVIVDCLENYALDGVNMDYIRYPESSGGWGYNPVSVARFNAFTGKTGQPAVSDPDWSDWRRRCVTHEVRKVYIKSHKVRPNVVITADTVQWGYSWDNWEASSAYAGVFQNWVEWLELGILDYNALMNYVRGYSDTVGRFNGWTDLSLASDEGRGSIIGNGAYLQTSIQDGIDQLLYARAQGAEGLNIYDWGSEMNANTAGESRDDFYAAYKAQLFPTWVDPPQPPWLANPTDGHFEGTVTAAGVPVDHATVMLEGQPDTAVYTDGSGWYAILKNPPGNHNLVFSKPGFDSRTIAAPTLAAGDIITVDCDFINVGPTPTPVIYKGEIVDHIVERELLPIDLVPFADLNQNAKIEVGDVIIAPESDY